MLVVEAEPRRRRQSCRRLGLEVGQRLLAAVVISPDHPFNQLSEQSSNQSSYIIKAGEVTE